MQVLIVDDEPDIRLILKLNLERWGHTVLLAADAEEAHGIATAHAPDALLTDVSMPGGSGLDLVRRLRAESALPPQVAVLSAMLPEHWTSSPESVGVLHLTKPFGIADLQHLIDRMAAAVPGRGEDDLP